MKPLLLGISCGFGLESVTQRELQRVLQIDKAPAQNGLLRFVGSIEDVVKANVYLRTAERVYIIVGEGKATTFDELFALVESMPWEDILPQDAKIHVKGKSVSSTLYGVSACQSIAKKAIVVRMHKALHTKDLPETGAEYAITVSLYKDVATLLLDTSGIGLHKRGYRRLVGEAAIKETMAASILQLSVWNKHKAFIDPFCGSGTFAIEAALAARNIAPGTLRKFAFDDWPNVDEELCKKIRKEAVSQEDRETPLRIAGFDIDPEAIKLCRYHAKNAGVAEDIHFQSMDMRQVESRYPYGVIATNPPYGERLLDDKAVHILMQDFAAVYRRLPNWSLYLITAYPFLEDAFGQKADKNRKLYNGKIECRLYRYMGEKPKKEE